MFLSGQITISFSYLGLKWKIFIFLVIVGLLSGLLYEFLAPGTWFQYQLCKRGCIKGHSATFKYTTHDIQVSITQPGIITLES